MKNLGTINVLGMSTKVLLLQPSETTEDCLSVDNHASFVSEDQTIYLNADSNVVPSRAKENIVHECVHAWLEASGAQHYLRGVCGLEAGAAWDRVEENLVRYMSPAISSSLPDLHKLLASLAKKLPKAAQ